MADLRFRRDRLNEFLRDFLRITVEYPDPVDAADCRQSVQQLRQALLSIQINTVQRCLLRDKNQLPDALLRQCLRLRRQLLHGNASVISSDPRNDAVGAALVAALGDFKIGEMPARRQHSVPVGCRCTVQLPEVVVPFSLQYLFNRLSNFLDRHGAKNCIHLRDLLLYLLAVALCETSRCKQCPDTAALSKLRHFQQCVDALLLGISDETAGIHYDNIRLRLIIREGKALLLQHSQHHLCVDKVLITPQRYKHNLHKNLPYT